MGTEGYCRHREPCVSMACAGGPQAGRKYSPIYLTFHKCLLSTYCAIGVVLHNGHTLVNKTHGIFIFMEVMGETREIKMIIAIENCLRWDSQWGLG